MNALPGIGGSLFPGRYLASAIARDIRGHTDDARTDRKRRQFESWWQRVALTCGPATGLRAIFDVVAMPLFGSLGFRARDASFERGRARVRLDSPQSTPVALVILPWASQPSLVWRDATTTARGMNARWCFILAPPFLSLVDARGHACRNSVEFTLPDVLDRRSFARFWTLAHAGVFDAEPRSGGPDHTSARIPSIEALVAAAEGFQDGVRADLQAGVIEALGALGRVLGRGAAREASRDAIDEALTLVYRVLFLLFAESRDLVPRGHPIYERAYAVATLCRDARSAAPAAGLWDGLAAVTRLSRIGCRTDDLIVQPFNGRLFARAAAPSLEATPRRSRAGSSTPRDAALQRALVALGTRPGPSGREEISYADLGVEHLGAVYERVLDLEPDEFEGTLESDRPRRPASARRDLPTRHHSLRRKQSGTFYTPQSLAEFVVRRTLAPLVSNAPADAILSLRVLDPAMGSGAFLVAACRYLAHAYERALVEEGRCADVDLDEHERANIRRLVAERCLAGVDANPTAVQLARLSLWLTTLAQGKPLGFLDHRLRVGNSLIGASPDDLGRLAGGRRHRGTPASLPLFDAAGLEDTMRLATRPLLSFAARRDDTIDDVHAKEATWNRLVGDASPLAPWRLAADLWCARWFDDGQPPPAAAELRAALDAVLKGDRTLRPAPLEHWLARARSIGAVQRFFHWPLEFADVFYDADGQPRPQPGFDAVIGNPPWEMLRRDAESRNPRAGVSAAADDTEGRPGNRQFIRFIRESGLYPACDRGHVNLYQPFLERALSLARPGGRVGLVLPWGLATDDGAAALRRKLFEQSAVHTLVGLDNAGGLFPIHRGLRFLVVVASPNSPAREVRARFGVRSAREIDDLPDRDDPQDPSAYPVRLTPRLLASVGGPGRRIPDVRHELDLALLERLMGEFPALGSAAGWAVRFGRELNATEDRASFGTRGLPVIDGKHIMPFSVDVASSARRIEPARAARLLPGGGFERPRLAYRDVSGVGNRLSLIAAMLPAGVVTTHTLYCLRTPLAIEQQHFLCGVFNSYVLNAVVRMLMGGHVTTSLVESLPVPPWRATREERRIARLAARLARRPSARPGAVLQGAVAQLYGLDAAAFHRVLESFPLVPGGERGRAAEAFGKGDIT
jgi:hypothetical protein